MRYWLVRVFSLMRYGPHWFTQNSSCSMLLGSKVICVRIYLYRTFTFYGSPFQTILIHQYTILNILQFFTTLSLYPLNTTAVSLTYLRFRLDPVRSPLLWVSIFTFFSSRYLDVSVHAVPSFVLRLHLNRLLHSEILDSYVRLQLI